MNRFKQVPIGEPINSNCKNWEHIIYGNGVYVATSFGAYEGAYSGDGYHWYEIQPDLDMHICCGVVFAKNLFVTASDSKNKIIYSTDGINWEQCNTDHLPATSYIKISYTNGIFVIMYYDPKVYTSRFIYSTDGINWLNAEHIDIDTRTEDIVTGNNMFITWNRSEPYGMYSINGKDWLALSGFVDTWSKITYGNNIFAACSRDNNFSYSRDGKTWLQGNYEGNHNIHYINVKYGGGKFVAAGYIENDMTGYFAYSNDGINWYQSNSTFNYGVSEIYYGKNMFVGVLSSNEDEDQPSPYFIYSKDGIKWNAGVLNGKWNRSGGQFIYANDRFVIVSEMLPSFAHSNDDIHWTSSEINYVEEEDQ